MEEKRLSLWEICIAYFVEELVIGAIALVEVWHGGITTGAEAVFGDTAFGVAVHGFAFRAIAFFDIGDEVPVIYPCRK